MTYRVALTYHPDVGTFRGKRGAWRVWGSWHDPRLPAGSDDVEVFLGKLVVPTTRVCRKGTWVNPLKILKEYQSTKRSNTQ